MTDTPFSPRLDAITTRWSLIQRAHGERQTSAVDARRVLVLRYAPAMKAYIRGITRDEVAADELSQDILVRLMQGDFAGADPGRGRFRDFLKTAVRNMVRNYWSREKRRTTVDLDVEDVGGEEKADSDSTESWDVGWKDRVLELAWAALQDSERQNPQSRTYSVLRLRADFPDDSSEQLAERLSEQLGQTIRPDALRQNLRRARVRFAECLVEELADGLNNPTLECVQEELIDLNLYDQVRALLPDDWHIKS